MDKVDLALVLAVDGSASVTYDEFNLIAGGMAAALRDADVVAGLLGGPAGASLGAVLLWSGPGAQAVLVPWTRIDAKKQAEKFAQTVDDIARAIRPGTTAIGEALLASLKLLVTAPAASARQVVDVIGDGRSNAGVPPGPVRDRMVQAGVVINGLCVLHEEPDLVASYEREVIGGPGAFALACPDYAAFAEAMRRKLLREITGKPIA
jgi:hypothetical protein